jgi:hypothetical protein
MVAELLAGLGGIGPGVALGVFDREIIVLEDNDVDIAFFHRLPNLNNLP